MRLAINVPKLKNEMVNLGWDEKKMAEVIGVSKIQVYRVLRGKREPGNEFIAGLYNVFDYESFRSLFLLIESCQKARDKKGG
jgi:transcriptional regulator with XRE-family HTH domain